MNDHLSNRQVLYGPAVPLFNYNHNHDPKNGQFTSGDGSGSDNGRFTATSGMSGAIAGSRARIGSLYTSIATPSDAKSLTAPDGTKFLAPPGTDFQAVYNAGKTDGTVGIPAALGHYGTFDFQRNSGNGISSTGNVFYPAYTDASNYAVGVYMNGAGYNRDETIALASLFALTMSSNAGSSRPREMWKNGWDAAAKGAPNGSPKN